MFNHSNYDYLPSKKTKTNAFTVRMDDKTHDELLRTAQLLNERRAVALVEAAKLGAYLLRLQREEETAGKLYSVNDLLANAQKQAS